VDGTGGCGDWNRGKDPYGGGQFVSLGGKKKGTRRGKVRTKGRKNNSLRKNDRTAWAVKNFHMPTFTQKGRTKGIFSAVGGRRKKKKGGGTPAKKGWSPHVVLCKLQGIMKNRTRKVVYLQHDNA